MNNSIALAADPSRLAALLLGHLPTGKLPRRALPSGRLDPDHRSTCSLADPKGPRMNNWIALAADYALRPHVLLLGGEQ